MSLPGSPKKAPRCGCRAGRPPRPSHGRGQPWPGPSRRRAGGRGRRSRARPSSATAALRCRSGRTVVGLPTSKANETPRMCFEMPGVPVDTMISGQHRGPPGMGLWTVHGHGAGLDAHLGSGCTPARPKTVARRPMEHRRLLLAMRAAHTGRTATASSRGRWGWSTPISGRTHQARGEARRGPGGVASQLLSRARRTHRTSFTSRTGRPSSAGSGSEKDRRGACETLV
jgi:hypothetical protein